MDEGPWRGPTATQEGPCRAAGIAGLFRAVGLVAAVVSFVWALALWVVSLGPLGAILGLVWVPDLALPFVVRARLGEWPWAWIIVSVAAFVLYAAGPLMDEGEGA